ncbi:MAG: hypothetical protein ABSG53_24185 [Thermoguttaceae bacterium]|jgi:hypothetical protein
MAFAVPAAPAHATNTRSWVSASGSDSNACTQAAPCLTVAHAIGHPCTRSVPCLTFGEAIGQTSSGGEVDCLDPGDFSGGNVVQVSASLTIDCGAGQVGRIGGTSGNYMIQIFAGSGGVVILRNLTINGLGAGVVGISVTSVGTLLIEHCNIIGFTDL